MSAAAGARAVVLDTNVALDLLVFDDPAVHGLRQALAQGQLRWIGLPGMRDELARVLTYPRVARQLDARGIAPQAVLAAFDAGCALCPPVAAAPVRCSDPDDQAFLDLALAYGALVLSKDHAVLDVRKRMAALGVEIAQRFVTNASESNAGNLAIGP